jgi:LuxR family maltose regulon positive regulatory protein
MHSAKFLPPCPLHILQRERLVERLLSWDDRKLVIIHGPAGQGKSTLAAGFVQSLRRPFVWYNLDREDENALLFLSSLVRAMQASASPRTPLPQVPQSSALDRGNEQGIRHWIRSAFAVTGSPFRIVFDDLHTAASSPVLLQLLQALIEETPPGVRFIILSRTRPDLRLADLRAKRTLGEISGEDLRFSNDEVMELFGSVFGMQVSPEEAAAINRKTEGWPVGLVLMHEYLSSAPASGASLQSAVSADTAFHSPVFDYLAQEVFSLLPHDLQQFLLCTSVADYLPEGLMRELWPAGAKSSRKDAASLVRELGSRNLFATPLNSDGSVLRYHSLFREFLRKKLEASAPPGEILRLYSRAAAWFRKNGDPVRAIDFLLESRQVRQARSLIEEYAAVLIARGQAGTLQRWRVSLPGEERDRPWFLVSAALTCRFADPRAALSLFEAAFRKFGTAAVHDRLSGRMLSLCGLIEACFHSGGDFARMEKAAALAQSLLARQGRDRSGMRARLLLALGTAWFFLGRLEKSRPALTEALDRFRKQGDPFYQITCAVYLTPCALYQGDFRLARQSLLWGFEAHALIPDDAASAAALYLTRAMAALFEGNFTEARDCIGRCKSMADDHALESIGLLSLDIEGWLSMAMGDYDAAGKLLAECRSKADQSGNAFFSASAAHLLAITNMFRGRLQEAKDLSDRALAIRSQSGSRLFHAIYLIAHGAIHLKLGRTTQAEKYLHASLAMLVKVKALQQEANAHLMLALLYRAKGQHDLFHRHLQAGFSIGRDLGFSYYALLTPPDLADLARAAVESGICEEYCAALLDRGAKTGVPLLTIECMGGFRVFRGRKRIPEAEWKSRLGKTLLKMLAANEGRIPRERAIEMLWPEGDAEKSRAQFNAMYHRLRKMLQPGSVPGRDIFCDARDGNAIALNMDFVRTDVRQFLDSVERARRLKSASRPTDLLTEYEQAIELYQGDFLPEDLYHDWAAETRERLRGHYLRTLEDAGDLAESLGEKKRAQQFFEKMLLADPCSERACRWLMTRYLSLGRRGEAIRVYERCERALVTEMELEPEEKTKKLYRSILGGAG